MFKRRWRKLAAGQGRLRGEQPEVGAALVERGEGGVGRQRPSGQSQCSRCSRASAAGYMTGGGTVAAIPALMMITGQVMGGWQMFGWITAIALLGVVMAIPMKQQMINVEQLRFPTGIAAAETLRALHGEGAGGAEKARWLGLGGVAGALVGLLRDASWLPWRRCCRRGSRRCTRRRRWRSPWGEPWVS
ncbi:MAG: OPT/YSL family transporter [Opitutaceae bacterium]|nr:OPT/YSL family transporter [Opitutaceae bacterium]